MMRTIEVPISHHPFTKARRRVSVSHNVAFTLLKVFTHAMQLLKKGNYSLLCTDKEHFIKVQKGLSNQVPNNEIRFKGFNQDSKRLCQGSHCCGYTIIRVLKLLLCIRPQVQLQYCSHGVLNDQPKLAVIHSVVTLNDADDQQFPYVHLLHSYMMS